MMNDIVISIARIILLFLTIFFIPTLFIIILIIDKILIKIKKVSNHFKSKRNKTINMDDNKWGD